MQGRAHINATAGVLALRLVLVGLLVLLPIALAALLSPAAAHAGTPVHAAGTAHAAGAARATCASAPNALGAPNAPGAPGALFVLAGDDAVDFAGRVAAGDPVVRATYDRHHESAARFLVDDPRKAAALFDALCQAFVGPRVMTCATDSDVIVTFELADGTLWSFFANAGNAVVAGHDGQSIYQLEAPVFWKLIQHVESEQEGNLP